MIETQNAIITSVSIDTERCLSAWLHLDYGFTGQGFGGFALYTPHTKDRNKALAGNYAGVFIQRCIEIGGVDKWEQLKGKTIRVRQEHTKVHAIGHIVKDDWFEPSAEFSTIQKMLATPRIGRTALAFRWQGETEDFPEWLSARNDPLARSGEALKEGTFLEAHATIFAKTAHGLQSAEIGDWVMLLPDETLSVLASK